MVFQGGRAWAVTGGDHLPVGPVEEFLDPLRVARQASPNTVRSYATSLDRWWGYLAAVGLACAAGPATNPARSLSSSPPSRRSHDYHVPARPPPARQFRRPAPPPCAAPRRPGQAAGRHR